MLSFIALSMFSSATRFKQGHRKNKYPKQQMAIRIAKVKNIALLDMIQPV